MSKISQNRIAAHPAKAMACIRNTMLEELHPGLAPVTKTGDYSDVFVVDADGNTLSRKITTSAAADTFSGRIALRSTLVPGGIAPDNSLWSDDGSRSAVDWVGNCQILSEISQLLIAFPSKGLAWICSSCSLHLRHRLCKLLFHVDLWIH